MFPVRWVAGLKRKSPRGRYDQRKPAAYIEAETAGVIRQGFWTQGSIPTDAHTRVDLDEWFAAQALPAGAD
jgi:hypothetical protein